MVASLERALQTRARRGPRCHVTAFLAPAAVAFAVWGYRGLEAALLSMSPLRGEVHLGFGLLQYVVSEPLRTLWPPEVS